MFFENQYRDNQPVAHWGRVPIYLTTIVVAVIVVGLLFSALGGTAAAFAYFTFTPELAWRHGEVWRAVTYLAVDQVNFFTIFNLLFLYSFGRDCELEMGRGRYAAFLAVLILVPVAFVTILWFAGISGGLVGSLGLAIGLVVAFATIYPNVLWWHTVPMKFVAIACIFLAAVGHISERDQVGLMSTLLTSAVSFGYVRGMRAGFFSGLSWPRLFRRTARPRASAPPVRKAAPSDADALLDKIAQSGFHSLTAEEKSRLEAVRAELLKKERRQG